MASEQVRVAVVTGSTSGIGLAIGQKFVSLGWKVVFHGSRSEEQAIEAVKGSGITFGDNVVYCPADLRKAEDSIRVVQTAIDTFGRIDVLVNNAGRQYVSPVDEFPADMWNDVIAINLTSCFHTIQTALPVMKKNGWGRIVNIASVQGVVASVNKAAYVSAKHGLNGLTKVVALETATLPQITCNSICPGWVLTPLVENQIRAKAEKEGTTYEEASVALVSEKQPTGTFTLPGQIADMTAFLCTDSCSNMTGSLVTMDGAWTAQ
eukprot:TRINITY_DN11305_c0_g1_i1.p1 TRINITY_DN11305_c0_g1~~TRINITY_DN11305_c0_g1_i1.p1  ORF type:complete len:274 (+),score=33.86 TRINITY_DN11305_c0_g1_i1:32-823(+)